MTEIPAPEWYASEYVVSCLPREHLAFRRFSLKVQWHAAGRWTVHVNGALVDIHGKVWAIGKPLPSDFYMPLADALALANRMAPGLKHFGAGAVRDVQWALEHPEYR
jgi:hypothetical protein